MRPLILVPTLFEAVQVFGEIARGPLSMDGHATARYVFGEHGEYEVHIRGSVSDPSLVDIAPGPERKRDVEVAIGVCGFGLAASGIGAMSAFAREGRLAQPSGSESGEPSPGGRPVTILIGIAGSYDPGAAPVGTVVIGSRATCDGIGAGTGKDFVGAGAMGWSQGHARKGIQPVQDTIELDRWLIDALAQGELAEGVFSVGEVLSVSAASGSADDAQNRRTRYSEALIEDMEAFAVALATRLSGGTLTVIRGVSNAVGDRDHRNWKTGTALAAVSKVLASAIGLSGSSPEFP